MNAIDSETESSDMSLNSDLVRELEELQAQRPALANMMVNLYVEEPRNVPEAPRENLPRRITTSNTA